MIVKPRIRGFICTTAHPHGCAAHVQRQIDYVKSSGVIDAGVANAVVVGCSGGYGLASRIVAAAGCGANTLGVSLEKAPGDKRTATAGWYNNVAFEKAVDGYARTLDGDAFSDEMKARAVETWVRSICSSTAWHLPCAAIRAQGNCTAPLSSPRVNR